eukprot:s744_g27.t1
MVSPAMLKGMNTEVYGEGHPFGDPSWYQAYNMPYYNDSHKQFQKLMREYVDEHIMSNVMDEKGVIPQEMYLEAGKQGTLALCIGRPWPEKYYGKAPWGFEPDYFHELIMDPACSCALRSMTRCRGLVVSGFSGASAANGTPPRGWPRAFSLPSGCEEVLRIS